MRELIIFGDSMSDVGRGGASADKQYYNNRYSDGPIWIDYLSEMCDSEPPSLSSDFAYGAATTDNTWVEGVSRLTNEVPPGVKQQIELYLQLTSNVALQVGEHVVWAGLNDFWYSLDNTGRLCDAEKVAANTAVNVSMLASAGAARVLVGLQLDMALYPAFVEAYPELVAQLKDTTGRHNEALKRHLSEVNNSTASEIIFNSERGLGVLLTATLHYNDILHRFDPNDAVLPAMKVDPILFVFDGWHPRTHFHKAIAEVAFKAVTGT